MNAGTKSTLGGQGAAASVSAALRAGEAAAGRMPGQPSESLPRSQIFAIPCQMVCPSRSVSLVPRATRNSTYVSGLKLLSAEIPTLSPPVSAISTRISRMQPSDEVRVDRARASDVEGNVSHSLHRPSLSSSPPYALQPVDATPA